MAHYRKITVDNIIYDCVINNSVVTIVNVGQYYHKKQIKFTVKNMDIVNFIRNRNES
jgi:hypothetical protein